ncbi:MAG: hypothetical protein HKP29_05865 [Silicimonas sp.]|nr:hypothetical protein [Silicimonas sp.]
MVMRTGFSAALCALVIAALLATGYLIGPRGWDDGAITVSFARTFALTGEFALTTISERVEGFSSLLYMALLSLLIPTDAGQMETQILISQWLTVASLTGAGIVLFLALGRTIPSAAGRLFIVAVFLAFPQHFRETMNGMEMTLFGFLLIAWVAAAERGYTVLELVLIPLILLTRFEAVFYLGVVYGALFLIRNGERGRFFWRGVLVLAVFGLITLGRWVHVGDIMPNTIWAKMQPPYSPDISLLAELAYKSGGPADFLNVMGPLLLTGLLFMLARPGGWVFRSPAFWLVVAFVLFSALTGRDYAYEGRLFLGVLPVIVFLVAEIVSRSVPDGSGGHGPFPVVATALVVAALVNLSELKASVVLVLKRMDETGQLPDRVAAAVQGPISRREFPATPLQFAGNGWIVDEVRRAIGEDRMVLMAPDVGGLGLCCEAGTLEVIDNALLTSRTLAREGYGALPGLLEARRPEMILTHFVWASESGIYDLELFNEAYRPMVVRDTLFWVRADVRDRLLAAGGRVEGVAGLHRLERLRNDLRAADLEFLTRGTPYPVEIVVLPVEQS